jgi:hypothetical protein
MYLFIYFLFSFVYSEFLEYSILYVEFEVGRFIFGVLMSRLIVDEPAHIKRGNIRGVLP